MSVRPLWSCDQARRESYLNAVVRGYFQDYSALADFFHVRPGTRRCAARHWLIAMSTIPWFKILKLSADIGSIMLRDVPILGTTLQVTNAVLDQGPGIIDDLKGRR